MNRAEVASTLELAGRVKRNTVLWMAGELNLKLLSTRMSRKNIELVNLCLKELLND